MDLLKQCTTTVHLIQGYSTIQYRVYELSAASLAQHIRLKAATLQSESSFKEYLKVKAIRNTEWALRNSGVLVAANAQMQLWLFGTSQEQLNEKLKACGHVTEAGFGIDGVPSFRFLRSGNVSASDILKDPTMTQKSAKAASGPASTSAVDSIKAGSSAGDATRSKGSSPLPDDPQFGHSRIYLFFMAACMQSIIMQLCKTGAVIPMNFKTVVFQQMDRWTLCGLDVSLTQKGDLLISMNIDDSSINSLAPDSNSFESRKIVRVAPAGRLGRVLPDCATHTQSAAYSDRENTRNSSSAAAWRKTVKDVLACRNINLKLENGNDSWCRVRLGEITKDMLHRKANTARVLDEQGAFEWPKELCFEYNEHSSSKCMRFGQEKSYQPILDDPGLLFFAQHGKNVWRDPLDEAEEFWMQARSKNDIHDDDVMEGVSDATVPQTVNGSAETDWEPPPLQHVPFQDMEQAALLYPTPPDGAPPSTSLANLVPEQSSNQRKDLVMLSPEVGDDFQDLFNDSALNVTEDDFSYFDQLDSFQNEAQAVTIVTTTALSEAQVEDQLVPPQESHKVVVANGSGCIPTGQKSISQAQAHQVTDEPRFKAGAKHTSPANRAITIKESPHQPIYFPLLEPDPLSFNLDEKYSHNGRFGSTDASKAELISSSIPKLITSVSNPNALINDNPLWKRFQSSRMLLIADDSDSESSATDTRQELDLAMRKSAKRTKIANEDSSAASSSVGTPIMQDVAVVAFRQEQTKMYHFMFLNMLCRSSPVDWSLSLFPAPSGKHSVCNTASTWTMETFIETAQLASAQLITSTNPLMHCNAGVSGPLALQSGVELAHCASLIRSSLLQAFDAGPVQQDVFVNTAIQSMNRQISSHKFQPKPVSRRNITDQADPSDHPQPVSSDGARLYNIPAPMLRVQRCENEPWNLLPPAYTFWDMLDLAPAHVPKFVKALVLYPDNQGLLKHVTQFMDMLKIGWQSSRLGSHELLNDPQVGNDLNPVELESGRSLEAAIDAYRLACQELAKRLRLFTPDHDESLVIYIFNPFETETAVFDLCSCFQVMIQELFASDEDGDQGSWSAFGLDQPVLQLIPIRTIVSLDGPVFPNPQAIASLSREVYGRCSGHLDDILGIPFTNAIELAEDPTKDFSFQLTTIPPASLLQDNSCLHIAYCRSYDDLWITAAWSDGVGCFQHQASYYMGKGQTVTNIAREIWESTFEFISLRKVHWRLFLVSAAPMPLAERKIWRDLAVRTKPQNDGPTFNLTLISANTAPIFQIYPNPTNDLFSAEKITKKDATAYHSQSITSPPTNTPTNTTFSPISTTPSATAAQTPMSMPDTATPRTSFFPPISNPTNNNIDNDPSTRLIDLADETCGIILSRRLNVARAVIDYHPALASGYLVKRTGINDTDVPVVLEVNIMAVDLVPAGTIPRISGGVKAIPQPSGPSLAFGAGQRSALPLPIPEAASAGSASSEAAKMAARQRRYDLALREVLVMYRRLALLARVRGLQDQRGTTPWHVVVVMRVAEGLRRCAGVPDSWK